MVIVKADRTDLAEVARLHVHAFPGFFLTSLGLSFLEELYAGFLSHPSGIFLLAKNDEGIAGFVAGTSDPLEFFPDLRRRRRFAFVFKAIPSVLRNPLPVCRKLLYAVRYRGEAAVTRCSGALLSSIGTTVVSRGSGVAASLILEFEKEAMARGVDFIYLTTDAEQNDRVNAFYQKNGYAVASRFQQNGRRDMLRYEKQLSA